MSKNVGNLRNPKKRILKSLDEWIRAKKESIKNAKYWIKEDLKREDYFEVILDAIAADEELEKLHILESVKKEIESIFEEVEDEE